MLAISRLSARRVAYSSPGSIRPIFRAQSTSTYQPPNAPKPNPHRDFYKNNGRPIFKSFLIAVATYEVIYWSWLKLESLETVQETNGMFHYYRPTKA
ncbi:hypothetical protein LTR95_003914 [Oleoguttula sp. CCFEE 5521]